MVAVWFGTISYEGQDTDLTCMKALHGVPLCLIRDYIDLTRQQFLEGFKSSLKHAFFGFVFLSYRPSCTSWSLILKGSE